MRQSWRVLVVGTHRMKTAAQSERQARRVFVSMAGEPGVRTVELQIRADDQWVTVERSGLRIFAGDPE